MSQALEKSKVKLGLYLIIPLVLFLLPLSLIEAAPSVCLFKNILGIECPGCGITRAVVSVLHGDWIRAWEYNRMVVVVFPLLCYLYLKGLMKELRIKDAGPGLKSIPSVKIRGRRWRN